MLFLIGMGLNYDDIPYSAIDTITSADEVLVDQYTNFIPEEALESIKTRLKINLRLLSRSELEENAKGTIAKAASSSIVILVPGDPLIATTHHTILDLAHKMGIEYRVFHAPSIFSAGIGESGLDIYKFGPTTTITFWSEKYKPTSFIDVAKRNVENGQHTMMLFDYHYQEKRRMRLGEAIVLLHAADEQRKAGVMTQDRKLLILGDIGKDTQLIRYVAFGGIGKEVLREFEGKTLTIVVPAKPSFAEEEALTKFI
ncbi:MAG: diphthine synthase [Candidatus Micrarchaeota archaeon]|nr:diphthine synthase [Candidatus Micrarchaeota archaeon]MDE1805083.1 diphthine synthase [Candidatus Micrarchaeota archaeon]MDE1846562.1 diphthine synthase [Candidatus Micrarchaeota archaeon]